MDNKAKAGVAVVSVALLTFVGMWEGRSLPVYTDLGGVPTVCDGHTGPDVKPGAVWTKEQCDAILRKNIEVHGSGILACVSVPINQNTYEALASWAFNVGVGAACKSTAIKLLNAGNKTAACDALLNWNRVNGKVIPGLVNRRKAERELCLKPVSAPVKATA